MLLSGLRSAEVLALKVSDVDIPRGWVLVTGKGDKERRVPVDAEVAGLIQTYLLAERPDTGTPVLSVAAKGRTRGRPPTAQGLRAVSPYHRACSAVAGGPPPAVPGSSGTRLSMGGL